MKSFLKKTLVLSENKNFFPAGLTRGEVECTADLLELVGEEVMECVKKQQEIGGEVAEVFQGLDMYREEGVCIMIHRIVHKCGNMWRNCYTDNEVSGCPSIYPSSITPLSSVHNLNQLCSSKIFISRLKRCKACN